MRVEIEEERPPYKSKLTITNVRPGELRLVLEDSRTAESNMIEVKASELKRAVELMGGF